MPGSLVTCRYGFGWFDCWWVMLWVDGLCFELRFERWFGLIMTVGVWWLRVVGLITC